MKVIANIHIRVAIQIDIGNGNAQTITDGRTVDAGCFCNIGKMMLHHCEKCGRRKADHTCLKNYCVPQNFRFGVRNDSAETYPDRHPYHNRKKRPAY